VFEIDIEARHFAYLIRGRGPSITNLTLFLQVDDIVAYQSKAPLTATVTVTPLQDGKPLGAATTHKVVFQSVKGRLGGLPTADVNVSGSAGPHPRTGE
jgi:hypothetical protein